jgi:hypothetical protein
MLVMYELTFGFPIAWRKINRASVPKKLFPGAHALNKGRFQIQ